MYTRSGEWVIISKVSKYIKADMLKSLRFRIALLVIAVGFCSGALMRAVILNSLKKEPWKCRRQRYRICRPSTMGSVEMLTRITPDTSSESIAIIGDATSI